jgi:hypothetical protein
MLLGGQLIPAWGSESTEGDDADVVAGDVERDAGLGVGALEAVRREVPEDGAGGGDREADAADHGGDVAVVAVDR